MKKIFFAFFLFVAVFSSYGAELLDYGFESFEDVDKFLFYGADEEFLALRKHFNSNEFLTFCNKVLNDSFEILTSDLSSSKWFHGVVPSFIEKNKEAFLLFRDLPSFDFSLISDTFSTVYYNFGIKNKIYKSLDIAIIGDLHGNYRDFSYIVKNLIEKDKILTKDLKVVHGKRIVFLGDFVDRGTRGLELSLLIFLLKCLNPESVTILKGNHEDFKMTQNYDFFDELFLKFRESASYKIYSQFICLFGFLAEVSFFNILENNFLFVHGGWSSNFDYEKFISEQDYKYIKTFEGIGNSPFLWNDISLSIDSIIDVLGRGRNYPVNCVASFMDLYKIDIIVKGHDHTMPKILKGEEYWQFSSGFCELLENRIYLTISGSIYGLLKYYPTYTLLKVNGDGYTVQPVVCSSL